MTPADQAKYKALYIQTSRQYLDKIDQALLELLENDQLNDETLKELFIAAHSLSGQSRVIGYNYIGEYAALIQKNIEEKVTLDTSILQLIQNGITRVAESIEAIEKDDKELDLTEEINKLKL